MLLLTAKPPAAAAAARSCRAFLYLGRVLPGQPPPRISPADLLPSLCPAPHPSLCCSFVPSQKVYAACVGPKIVLEYVPKVCILDEDSQQVRADKACLEK